MKVFGMKLMLVEEIPEQLYEGIFYYSHKYRTATHLCACGCGNRVVTPMKPGFWEIKGPPAKFSISPSIGSFQFPCKSHYFIRGGKVVWL